MIDAISKPPEGLAKTVRAHKSGFEFRHSLIQICRDKSYEWTSVLGVSKRFRDSPKPMDVTVNGIRLLCRDAALDSDDYHDEWVKENMQSNDLLLDTGKGDIVVIKAENRTVLAQIIRP